MERRAIRWELNGSCDGVDVDMVEEGDDDECDELDPVVAEAVVDGCRGSGGTTIVIARDGDDDESGERGEREEKEDEGGGRERDIDCPRVLFDDGDVIT